MSLLQTSASSSRSGSPQSLRSPFSPSTRKHPYSEFHFLEPVCRSFATAIADERNRGKADKKNRGTVDESNRGTADEKSSLELTPIGPPKISRKFPMLARENVRADKKACDQRGCSEVHKTLTRARHASAVERLRLQSDVELMTFQLQAYLSESSPIEREVEALGQEGAAMEETVARLRAEIDSLQRSKKHRSQEAESLRVRKYALDQTRLAEQGRVVDLQRALSQRMWRPGTLNQCAAVDECMEGIAQSHLESVVGWRLPAIRLPCRNPRARTSPAIPCADLCSLQQASRHSLQTNSQSIATSTTRCYKGYTPTGSRHFPRENSIRQGFGRSYLQHDSDSSPVSVAGGIDDDSYEEMPLDPIFYDARARSEWGRSCRVGAVRIDQQRFGATAQRHPLTQGPRHRPSLWSELGPLC
jgi:hypothetical protein